MTSSILSIIEATSVADCIAWVNTDKGSIIPNFIISSGLPVSIFIPKESPVSDSCLDLNSTNKSTGL